MTSFIDFADWPLQPSSSQGSVYSMSPDSETTSLLLSQFPSSPTTPASRPNSESKLPTSPSDITSIVLHPAVTISFSKGSRLFKLRYSLIDIHKDLHGSLKRVELSESPGLHGTFVHSFPSTRLPVPHIEQPIVSGQKPSFIVSFLEEQTIQTAQTIFSAQPHYTFDSWEDCLRFQEILLKQKLLFVAGIAEAKSKGRGEECISQNLRILQANNGCQSVIFFANSQRKEKKRYVSIPLDCIDQIDEGKKAGRPVTLGLRPNSDLLSQMKTLQVHFLDDNDKKRFCGILFQGVGAGAR